MPYNHQSPLAQLRLQIYQALTAMGPYSSQNPLKERSAFELYHRKKYGEQKQNQHWFACSIPTSLVKKRQQHLGGGVLCHLQRTPGGGVSVLRNRTSFLFVCLFRSLFNFHMQNGSQNRDNWMPTLQSCSSKRDRKLCLTEGKDAKMWPQVVSNWRIKSQQAGEEETHFSALRICGLIGQEGHNASPGPRST